MSKALLKKSMQILEESKPRHIFGKETPDSKTKNGKVKRKKQKAAQKQLPPSSTSKVEDNVKRLLKLSSFKLNDKLVQSAFKRSASRHYTLPDKEKAPEQTTSCFSEEDFKRFAAEYTV